MAPVPATKGSAVAMSTRGGFICRADPLCGVAFYSTDCGVSMNALIAMSDQRTAHEQEAHAYVHAPDWTPVVKRGPQLPPTWRKRPERPSRSS